MEALHFKETEILFQNLYTKFSQYHNQLKKITRKENSNTKYPKTLRLFRVRLRLVIGMEFRFNKEYSMVKNRSVESTYRAILKNNEAWFSFEALTAHSLLHQTILHDLGALNNSKALARIFNYNNEINLMNNLLNKELFGLSLRKNHVKNYLKLLVSSSKTHLAGTLNQTLNKIDNKYELDEIDILGIAYATRNLFVHQGESAYSGSRNYSSKIRLLKIVYDFLILYQLNIINFYLKEEINH